MYDIWGLRQSQQTKEGICAAGISSGMRDVKVLSIQDGPVVHRLSLLRCLLKLSLL